MRLGELPHELVQPRALPSLGTGIGLPMLAVSVLAEDAAWHRWLGVAAGIFIAAGHLAKLALDFNRGMRSARLTDASQQEQIDELKAAYAEQRAKLVELDRRVYVVEGKP